MKRILLPATGALLATGLLAAGLATSAQAEAEVDIKNLAPSGKVQEAVDFWLAAEGAALIAADEYRYDYKAVSKLVHTGGYTTDTKPGLIGQPKTTVSKVHNVNIPRTIGKVFFTKNGGKDLYWCSATSIQSSYKNLVATAGHCVYDVAGNQDTLENWVFIPGSYQAKAPYGIYVGKTAYTHSDFSVYEDYDRDYAFVTVYNGIGGTVNNAKQVTKSEYDAYTGKKYIDEKPITQAEYLAGVEKYGINGPYQQKALDPKVETVAKPADAATKIEAYITTGVNGVKLVGVEVVESVYNAAPAGLENGYKFERLSNKVAISKEDFDALSKAKADGKFLGVLAEVKDDKGNVIGWTKQQFFVKKWVKSTVEVRYFVESYFVVSHAIKDVGPLAANVGAQGFAWNQPTGKYVRTFGYPGAEHPDGSKPFSGRTPKWCYGKTSAKTPAGVSTYKAEELLALKCAVTPGYNGSAWLYQYSNAKRVGYVNGVTTAIYGDADGNGRIDTIFSPYFDGETKQVYDAAAKNWSGNAG
ncbi:trypsin-like serine peptidase [Nonomuraea sp. NPDC050663]|uniref:trypsin-like serine peptidase n=1 Tax=Nonomuraea sp. NPDC050663 TaxID=3364370 RepID=UPI00378A46B1